MCSALGWQPKDKVAELPAHRGCSGLYSATAQQGLSASLGSINFPALCVSPALPGCLSPKGTQPSKQIKCNRPGSTQPLEKGLQTLACSRSTVPSPEATAKTPLGLPVSLTTKSSSALPGKAKSQELLIWQRARLKPNRVLQLGINVLEHNIIGLSLNRCFPSHS